MSKMHQKGNQLKNDLTAILLLLGLSAPVYGQQASVSGYAPLARAYLAEPIVVQAIVRDTKKVPKSLQVPMKPGYARQLVEVDIIRVLKAPGLVNARITYLWEGPVDNKGKSPSFKKQMLHVFLRPLQNPDVAFQLVSVENQKPWSAANDALLRAIAQEAALPDMRSLRITGLQSAFTTESDPPFARLTQYLFETGNRDLLGITVRVRPDGTGDVIRSSQEFLGGGTRIQANSLLWYHLACTTPADIPPAILSDQPSAEENALVLQDYKTFKKALGPCK
jgi:hypothetical protein